MLKDTLVGGNQNFPSCYLSSISFQTCGKEIKLLILDEKSMVGRSQVGQMDCHLCKANPQNADEILGGIPTIFFGDFGQLPPVGDSPMYSDKPSTYNTVLHAEDCHLFESFKQSGTLNSCKMGD